MPTHFAVTPVVVGEQTLVVALADTPGLRSQGLMNVTDLGDLDGMLFAFDEESNQAFWMKDTLIPLDIAFFANNGALVSQTTMIPCEADPCPTYESEGPARYALEVPAGDLDLLGDVSGLALGLPY